MFIVLLCVFIVLFGVFIVQSVQAIYIGITINPHLTRLACTGNTLGILHVLLEQSLQAEEG